MNKNSDVLQYKYVGEDAFIRNPLFNDRISDLLRPIGDNALLSREEPLSNYEITQNINEITQNIKYIGEDAFQ